MIDILRSVIGSICVSCVVTQPELTWDKSVRWDAMHDENVKTCIMDLKAAVLKSLGSFFEEYKSS